MFQGKDSACQCKGVQIPSLVREDPLEQEMATHSSLVAWEIPWTEEPGRLQSRGRKESDTTHNDEETAARWSGGGGGDRLARGVVLGRVLGDHSFSVKNEAGMPRVSQ